MSAHAKPSEGNAAAIVQLKTDLAATADMAEKKRIRRQLRIRGHRGGLRTLNTQKARNIKIIVEKHSDGYIAYPLGVIRGAVVGQGESYEEALADVKSAIRFHIETFGKDAIDDADSPILEAFIAEAGISV